MQVLEHVGFAGIYLTDPDFVVTFHSESGVLGTFGFWYCTEQELLDFTLWRAAELLGTGRFDSRLGSVTAEVMGDNNIWNLHYDYDNFAYRLGDQPYAGDAEMVLYDPPEPGP